MKDRLYEQNNSEKPFSISKELGNLNIIECDSNENKNQDATLIKAKEIAIVKQEVSDIPHDKGDKEKTDGVEIQLKDFLVDISNFEEILHKH